MASSADSTITAARDACHTALNMDSCTHTCGNPQQCSVRSRWRNQWVLVWFFSSPDPPPDLTQSSHRLNMHGCLGSWPHSGQSGAAIDPYNNPQLLIKPYTHTMNPCVTLFPGGIHPYIAIHSYLLNQYTHTLNHCVLYPHLEVIIFFSEDWNSDYKKACIELTNSTTFILQLSESVLLSG